MYKIHPSNSLRALQTVLFLALLLTPVLVWSEENAEDTLGLFTAWQEQSSTAARAPKPLSQTAENISIITAKEIEALNAHTLADVLATVSGLQTWSFDGPGSATYLNIQGSDFRHVQVLLDDIPLNNLGDNYADTALVPANIIERIEIIKGAASSVWGQALGGVINVITKAPDKERAIGGSASASIGERTTADTRAELTGTSGKLGYYLSGGYLGSNGLITGTSLGSNNAYAKLTYDLPDQGQLWGTFDYSHAIRENFNLPIIDFKEDQNFRYLYASLGFRKPLTEQLELEFIVKHATRDIDTYDTMLSDGSLYQDNVRNLMTGVSGKLVWRLPHNLLVAGSEYEHDENKDAAIQDGPNELVVDRWGLFLNDTVTIGPVAVIPGVRFDHTGNQGDQFSPSLGATWQMTDNTLVRAYTARGFSLPAIVNNLVTQKVWTSQIGVESTAVPYIWLKATLFRNEVWNIIDSLNMDSLIPERRISLGSELEARTTSLFNTSLGAGWTYTDTYRTFNGTPVLRVPRHTLQLAVRYDDQTYRGTLTGRHIYWHSDPTFNGRYYGLIWDLSLGATLLKKENSSLELFFSGHNLFNGRLYQDELMPNAGRWFEGGMKVRF